MLQVFNGTAWMATGQLTSGLDKSLALAAYWLLLVVNSLSLVPGTPDCAVVVMQALSKGTQLRILCSRWSGTRRGT